MRLTVFATSLAFGWMIGQVLFKLFDDGHEPNVYSLHLLFLFVLFHGLDKIIYRLGK